MAVLCADCKSENAEDSKFCRTCGTPMEPGKLSSSLTKTIAVPKVFSEEDKLFARRYMILSSLGRGGMGDVFKVRDTKLNEEMALKQLRPEIASDPDILQRFRNELKLARKITHRNVCRVFDFHEEEGTPFITMEYVEGENLKSRIREQGKFSEQETLNIAIQIAEGLAEAHELGVIHRDLKPQNVMIEPGGRAKIMDFGIARSIDASGLTQTGQMIGTPDYLSSEQAAGRPADHRADIYALSVILFEMTTGRLPFQGDTALSIITKHRESDAVDPRDINSEISEAMSRLILRCLEKEPEKRYQSARDLLEDLNSLSKGLDPEIAERKTRRDLFGTKMGISYVSAGVLALIAVVILFWKKSGLNPTVEMIQERPSLAVLYFANNTGDEGLAHWRKGFAELLTSDLSQSKYLNVLPGDRVFQILDELGQLEAANYSSDVLTEVAQRGNVRHVLRGSYIRAGSRFRVSVSLQDMETGELVGSRSAEAIDEGGLFALVDDLTRGIKTDINLTSEQIASDFDKAASDVMTSSPEAYKLFVEGMRHLYRAEYQKCIEFMDEAIAIDPEFASAYAYKAWSYDSWGYYAEFAEAMTKAFELSKNVSERERFRNTAYYYMRVENDIPKALEELQKFASFYPEDIFANHQLGYLYFHAFEDYEKAVEYLRPNVENNVEMFYSYYTLAWVEMCLGDYESAQDICERYLSTYGEHPEIRFNLSINYLCRGKYERALEEAERAAELGFAGTHWEDLIKGGILQAQGDIAGAERHYRNMADSRDALIGIIGREFLGQTALLRGRFEKARLQVEQALSLAEASGDDANMSRLFNHLAYICLQTGDYEEALGACNRALEYGKKSMDPFGVIRLTLHLKGLSQLALGNSAAAVQIAEELLKMAEQGTSPRGMKNYLHLSGSIEMANGNHDNAIKSFEAAVSLLPAQNQDDLSGFKDSLRRTLYLAFLAKVYFLAGDMENSRLAYEELIDLSIGRHYWGDVYSVAFYWLGRISEELKQPSDAAAHYQEFLELWKDADPGLPEVADAQKRLAGLNGN